ncbi:MAG: hypothetical protein IKO53_00965 [Lachnospiraceae bacterium]|nr:hypothetical protein [Lachnospiraceae bacterium]
MLKEFVIGASVEGHVDRPLGTAHPDYPTMVYPINYGYVDGIIHFQEKYFEGELLRYSIEILNSSSKI